MASPPLRVFLSKEEDRTLRELIAAKGLDRKMQQRAELIRLSAIGWKVKQIAEYLAWSEETVRRTINKWKKEGLAGLRDKKRKGRPTEWKEEDLNLLEQKINEDSRSYNSKQLREIWGNQRNIWLSERQIRRILKKKL